MGRLFVSQHCACSDFAASFGHRSCQRGRSSCAREHRLGRGAEQTLPDLIETTWSKGRTAIVWDIRFPRALLALMVGAGLAAVGASLQAVTRNPLADPHLLGISSGGAFGAILALLHTGLFLGLLTVPLLAFAGALVATLLVLTVSSFASATSADRLVLTGVAISFIIMACANILIFLGDPRGDPHRRLLDARRPRPRAMVPPHLSADHSDPLSGLALCSLR